MSCIRFVSAWIRRSILSRSPFRVVRWRWPFGARRGKANSSRSRNLVTNMNAGSSRPEVSKRIRDTQQPTVVLARKYEANRVDSLSLGQGVVFWTPPEEALDTVMSAVKTNPTISSYGPDEGNPQLRERLIHKISVENGLDEYDVMVTAGANQAFVNCFLTLCDSDDGVLLFKPYYFNHAMAIQMTGSYAHIIEGVCDPNTFQPDLDWLEKRFQQPDPPKMVVLINPNNPTGVLLSKASLERAAEICRRNSAWLLMDNTYEYFIYNGQQHHCISGPHIIHLFSFSKAYGMMGWRVGYIAYPKFKGHPSLGDELIKVQDTIAICASQIGQRLALACLSFGRQWVRQQIQTIERNRLEVLDALSPIGTLGNGIYGGEGSFYIWIRLPEGCNDDGLVVYWMVQKHGVNLIPGSSCGCPGFIRVAFGNLPYEKCQKACARLRAGLKELVDAGMTSVELSISSL